MPPLSDPERLADAVDAAIERLRREAAYMRQRMDEDPDVLEAEEAIAGWTKAIADLRAARDELPSWEQWRLRDARRERSRWRADLEALRRPYLQQERGLLQLTRQAERLLRKHRRSDGPEALEALLAAAEYGPVRERFRAAETRLLRRVRSQHESLAREPARAEQPPETDSARFAAYLPRPTSLRFDEADSDLVARLARKDFDSATDYALNRLAQAFSLFGGFDVLLGLQSARNLTEYPHQLNTAKQVLRRFRGRALLCDEVGLGKTIEAGLVLKEYLVRGLVRKALVLVPPALVSQWHDEMADKFGVEFVTHESPEFRAAGAEAWSRFDRVIASVHTAKRKPHRERIAAVEYDLVIVDEAHHLKSRATLAWQFVNELKQKYLLLLTATPVQNDLDELYNLITLLKPGHLKTPKEFRRRFVTRGAPRQPRDRTRLRELMMDVMVRNTRSQVNVMLPPRFARTDHVKLAREEAELYREVTRLVRERYADPGRGRLIAQTLQAEVGSSARAVAATLQRMAQRDSADGAELAALRDRALAIRTSGKERALLGLLARDAQKFLVFTRYRETQRRLLEALAEAGIPAARFAGDMSAADKDAHVRRFAEDARVLVSTDVGSEGRNLQFCHALVNYDLPWNPMRIEQRVGRVHRIGQTESVLIVNFSAAGTLESHLLRVLDEKIRLFELVVGEIGMILGDLDTEREFEDLALDVWLAASTEEGVQQGFDALGEQLQQAQRRYVETKAYDEHLFGDEFVAEE